MRSRATRVAVALATAIALTVALAGGANAAVWKFNGTELTGNETIVGAAISSSLAIPGATTTCEHFLYNMKVKNSAGKGEGEITELPLYECTAGAVCTVKSITPEKLPWKNHLTTIGGKDYLFVEGIQVTITYSGEACSIEGRVLLTGTAAGVIENATQKATFNKTTFEAAGASLKVGSSSVEWKGEFPTEAFETRREQLVEG